jgi:hypothetical protein
MLHNASLRMDLMSRFNQSILIRRNTVDRGADHARLFKLLKVEDVHTWDARGKMIPILFRKIHFSTRFQLIFADCITTARSLRLDMNIKGVYNRDLISSQTFER